MVHCVNSVEFLSAQEKSFSINAGDYFIINSHNDIAGISRDAFAKTYEVVSESARDVQEAIGILINDKEYATRRAKFASDLKEDETARVLKRTENIKPINVL